MSNRLLKSGSGKLPLKLQFFAEPSKEGGGSGSNTQDPSPAAGQQPEQIDYEKIQKMLDGTLAAKEDTALKAYFKQQGLSMEDAETAMAKFKAEKAKNQPDIGMMQTQLAEAQKEARNERIQNAAIMTAVSLGIDAKTIPYVLKMADFSQAVGQDGKMSEDAIKNALNKVLEDVPALKPQKQTTSGFQMGAPGGNQQQSASDEALKKAFGL